MWSAETPTSRMQAGAPSPTPLTERTACTVHSSHPEKSFLGRSLRLLQLLKGRSLPVQGTELVLKKQIKA